MGGSGVSVLGNGVVGGDNEGTEGDLGGNVFGGGTLLFLGLTDGHGDFSGHAGGGAVSFKVSAEEGRLVFGESGLKKGDLGVRGNGPVSFKVSAEEGRVDFG